MKAVGLELDYNDEALGLTYEKRETNMDFEEVMDESIVEELSVLRDVVLYWNF